MRVEEIDARTADDATLQRFVEVEHACWGEVAPGEPLQGVEAAIAFYRHQPETHTSIHWLADGGFAGIYIHGPTAAFLHLYVHPDRRRHGVGSALLAAVVERCVVLDVRAVHARHATPAGAAFARHHGFTDGQRDVRRLLDLRTAELPAPTPPDGWSLPTWIGRIPDEHLAAYVKARPAMDDAPTPENMNFPTWDAETIRASEESLRRRQREMRLTVALGEDGTIGAFTELRVSRGSPAAFTDDTGTVAQHRRIGLARAIKLESLRRLREDHPELELVTTSNAEENAGMRALNESVGFRVSMVETTATLLLTGRGAESSR